MQKTPTTTTFNSVPPTLQSAVMAMRGKDGMRERWSDRGMERRVVGGSVRGLEDRSSTF